MARPKIITTTYHRANRFKLTRFLTRFGEIVYFVADAHALTDAEIAAGDSPPIVYQGTTRHDAMRFIVNAP